MDVMLLAETLRQFLAPALPFLLKAAEKASEEAGKEVGSAVSKKAKAAWDQLGPAVAAKPAALEAAQDAVETADTDAQTVWKVQLKKILAADSELAGALLELLATVPTYQGQVQGGVLVQGDSAIAGGEVAVGHDVHGHVIVINTTASTESARLLRSLGVATPAADLRRDAAHYLELLLDQYRYLDFRGMGVSDRVPLRMPLLEMYVPLRARIEMPEGEAWARQLRLAGRSPSADEAEAMGQRLSEPQPVLELLRTHDGLIVLGDPGAGKTTFLKFLALLLATGQGEKLGLGDRLPVLVPLSAYATALEGEDVSLERFLHGYYENRSLALPMEGLLVQAFEQGKALVFFDGLDEVREPRRRRLVVDRVVELFCARRKAGNKFVLTSRIVGYRDVRPNVEGLGECTLVDFEDDEIGEFVEKWTAALERAAQGESEFSRGQAEEERRELMTAVAHNPGVRQLASNPLLLTILALMKRQGVALPERRAELYENYVSTLLRHWNLARGLDRRGAWGLDVAPTLRILEPLALWMHETSPGVGLVKEHALRQQLQEILTAQKEPDPAAAADAFLVDLREHAGLLIERGQRRYGFLHLTFQEYLAGRALAQRAQEDVTPLVEALSAHLGDATWHEASLLAIGFLALVQQRDQATSRVLERLLEEVPGAPGAAVNLVGEPW